MAKKKKKVVREIHTLNEDCRECLKARNLKMPIVKEMAEGCNVTCLKLNGSLPYIKKMTDVVEVFVTGISEEHGDKNQQKTMQEYFADVRHIIEFYEKMRNMNVSE